MGLHPWWRVKFRRGSHIWGSPSPAGPSAGTEGKLGGLRKRAAASHWQAGQRETHTDVPGQSPAHPMGCLRWVSASVRKGRVRSRSGKETAVGCEETVWGDGKAELCNQEYSWRSSGHRRRQAPLLSDVQCSGATIAASLLTHWPRPPRALRGAPMDPTHTPLPPLPLPSPTTLAAAHSNCVSAPSCWRGSCASAISGTDSGGRNTYKSRSETIAETQCPCD